jgi:hypothetical protein
MSFLLQNKLEAVDLLESLRALGKECVPEGNMVRYLNDRFPTVNCMLLNELAAKHPKHNHSQQLTLIHPVEIAYANLCGAWL